MKRVLMFDAIPMQGGSKIANAELLKQCNKLNVVGYLVTTKPEHWTPLLEDTPRIQILNIKAAPFCSTHGLIYWLMNAFYLIQLLKVCMKLPKIDWYLGLSCPSNDMPLYLMRLFSRKPVVQMIHGPVGVARSSGYCLVKASAIYYLSNTRESLINALQAYLKTPKPATERYWSTLNASTFVNGLSRERWPKQANPISNRVFWAASLLKWKNVDLLLDALTLENTTTMQSTICYIKPNVPGVEYSTPDFNTKGVDWYESPNNLNELRAQCGVFVSTSVNEPFGLSILEALASGMCVVIPHDDSYWDRVLTHGKNCIKYTPNNAASLHNAIRLLNESPWMKVTMGLEALNVAQLYSAERCYMPIAQYLCSEHAPTSHHNAKARNNVKGYDHV
ncbi:TPA: glycosyltransferase family 4 protein [Vibrio parahaemolyticus]|nr:glycosyltransferase family 4 protein [Vibrio parahaemolyticus]HBC3387130.1 glycosyltransferase family 4 protein [Vibrio parahaemolyticus]